MAEQDGTLIAGRYRIERPLAQGGMGAIFVAEHVELGTRVAIKRLSRERGGDEHVARFRREAIAAAQLKSQHIVHVFDFGEDELGPYIIMELLEGEDLGSFIDREGRVAPERALRIFEQMCVALIFAHKAGIVHRDIKPGNVFLAREPTAPEPVIKVLDFGIAKHVVPALGAQSLTASRAILGSPGYMSPEQVRGQAIDPRTDVWALAVVLYELLTGRSPFVTEHVGDTLARICAGTFELASERCPDLDRAWDEVFRKGMAVAVEARYQTVEALREGVRAAAQASLATGPRRNLSEEVTRTLTAPTAFGRPPIASDGSTSTHDAITNTRPGLPMVHPVRPVLLFAILGGIASLGAWFLTRSPSREEPLSPPASSPVQPSVSASGGQEGIRSGPTAPEPETPPLERPSNSERARGSTAGPAKRKSSPPVVTPPSAPAADAPAKSRRDPFTGIAETP